MSRPHSHVHGAALRRSYFGELDAEPLIEWLNSKNRPARDPVERLIEMNTKLPFKSTQHQIRSYLARLVARSRFAVAPSLVEVTPKRWGVKWGVVGNMDRRQAEALIKLLQLADRGLLGRIRKCERCHRWFFARFIHQKFDSEKCQLAAFRSNPEFRQRRREYMVRLREQKKR